MKHLVQNMKTGATTLEEGPGPTVQPGQVLIQTRRSLVSLGTERMLVSFGKAGLLAKARQQPERLKQVLDKAKADGWIPTFKAVSRKLDQPLSLGYCNVGTVLATGEGVADLSRGDRVVSNGPHAEIVSVSRNLVAPIPDAVSDDAAAFTVVAAIGLNGIRLIKPTLGETVVVIGLGLIGQLTAQLLKLNGCRVIGIDIDEVKCQLAETLGIPTIHTIPNTDPVANVMALTDGIGADGVIITAASKTDELVAQAAQMSRQHGRIILVGDVGLNLNRTDFYKKELMVQVSCSYGPGRYDPTYEQQGQDYPIGFVRWTENRNFRAILQLLKTGQLVVDPLITDRVPLHDYRQLYDDLHAPHRIASLLVYPEKVTFESLFRIQPFAYKPGSAVIGIIGAGNFTGSTLLPALKKAGASLKTIASANGASATTLARKYGIAESTNDYRNIVDDPAVDLCIITTRHDSHAPLVVEALQAGKHVYVEKPLVIYEDDLFPVFRTQQEAKQMVMVGFNRRFSPFVQRMKALLGQTEAPMNVVITVNAGFVPPDEWVHDRAMGGGRILGEVGHFVDLISFLTGNVVTSVCMNAMGNHPTETTDSASLLLRYTNGSTGVINYFSNGHKAYSKERVEVYAQGRTLVLDNFRELTGYGFVGFSRMRGRQDKGHISMVKKLLEQLQNGGHDLIPFREIINTTQTTLGALKSLRQNRWVNVDTVGNYALVTEPFSGE